MTTGSVTDTAGLARDVLDFAIDPSPARASRLPLAPRVHLGLGPELVATRQAAELTHDGAWLLYQEDFHAYLGPFSALRVLRHHVDDAETSAIGAEGAFEVTTGPRPACASRPNAAPAGYELHERLSLQPSRRTYDTCLLWFSVDLFLDEHDRIAAVTLDLWEP